MKKKMLKMFAPLVKFDPNPYWKFLMATTILGGIYFYCLLWNIGYYPTGHYAQMSPPEMYVVIFVQTSTAALALSAIVNICLILVSSLVMSQLFKLEWRRTTGQKWVSNDRDPWSYQDRVLAQLAWNVKSTEHLPYGTVEPHIKRFWHAQIIAGALEDGHHRSGMPRELGDINHYAQLYKRQSHSVED